MPTIITRATGVAITVAAQPVLVNGIWECGDHRFVDPTGELFTPGPAEFPKLTAVQFYMAFTPQERIAIKTSIDPMVEEFWQTYNIARETNTPINPNLASVQAGLEYLAALTPPLIGAGRIMSILQGVPA